MEIKFITIEEYNNLLSILQEIKNNLNPKDRIEDSKLSDNWLTIDQTCQLLSISRRTLQSYRDNGTLPFSQYQNKIYFKANDIEAHLQKNYKSAFNNN